MQRPGFQILREEADRQSLVQEEPSHRSANYDPLFSPPDLVENDYNRFQNQADG